MATILDLPTALLDELIATRRDLHAHPELGFEEVRTAGIVAGRLRELGYEVHERIGTTGVVGVLRGARRGQTIMLRADMDALPLPEENDSAYKSVVPGAMHACGHDGHVAILLGAARLLAERREQVAGTLVLCFQPAEEGKGGAKAMVDEGLLERFGIERAYGLHLFSQLPTGVSGCAKDRFTPRAIRSRSASSGAAVTAQRRTFRSIRSSSPPNSSHRCRRSSAARSIRSNPRS
jgi:amidohydrolase